jgi:hypothetical protein
MLSLIGAVHDALDGVIDLIKDVGTGRLTGHKASPKISRPKWDAKAPGMSPKMTLNSSVVV